MHKLSALTENVIFGCAVKLLDEAKLAQWVAR